MGEPNTIYAAKEKGRKEERERLEPVVRRQMMGPIDWRALVWAERKPPQTRARNPIKPPAPSPDMVE